jgi:hypothetical protein
MIKVYGHNCIFCRRMTTASLDKNGVEQCDICYHGNSHRESLFPFIILAASAVWFLALVIHVFHAY